MYKIMMVFGTEEYEYGTYSDRNRANEIALALRDERHCDTYVMEV